MNNSRIPIRFFYTLAILLFFSHAILARGNAENGAADHTAVPQRVVQAGPAAFMVENALYLFPEAFDRVVAVADGDQGRGFFIGDLDSMIHSKTVLPRRANTEAILALRPDVVVMKKSAKSSMGEPLERLKIATFYLDLESPEAWMNDLETVGRLFDNPDRVYTLKNHFTSRISFVTGKTSALQDQEKPRTLFLYWSVKNGVTTVNIPPISWMQTHMVQMAGGIPVWMEAENTDGWIRTGIEQIAAWDPDKIIVAAYHIDAPEAVKIIKSDAIWSEFRAVKNGEVYAVPTDYHSWDQPDVRWLLGLQWLASVLHPNLFDDLDMLEEAMRFYQDMFGMTHQEFNTYVRPKLIGLD